MADTAPCACALPCRDGPRSRHRLQSAVFRLY